MIPRVSGITRLHVVPVPHTNEATYVLDAVGGRWIAKREAEMGSEALVAEAAAWQFARIIGAPVPGAAFCDDPGERTWLSAVVPHVFHWFAAHAPGVTNGEEFGAILAVDVLVFNEARHARNILAESLAGEQVRLWAIDADEALIGHPADYRRRLADIPSVRNHARGLPIDRMANGARAAALRLAECPAAMLRAATEEACEIGREPDAATLGDLVLQRACALPDLVEGYIHALRGLR